MLQFKQAAAKIDGPTLSTSVTADKTYRNNRSLNSCSSRIMCNKMQTFKQIVTPKASEITTSQGHSTQLLMEPPVAETFLVPSPLRAVALNSRDSGGKGDVIPTQLKNLSNEKSFPKRGKAMNPPLLTHEWRFLNLSNRILKKRFKRDVDTHKPQKI